MMNIEGYSYNQLDKNSNVSVIFIITVLVFLCVVFAIAFVIPLPDMIIGLFGPIISRTIVVMIPLSIGVIIILSFVWSSKGLWSCYIPKYYLISSERIQLVYPPPIDSVVPNVIRWDLVDSISKTRKKRTYVIRFEEGAGRTLDHMMEKLNDDEWMERIIDLDPDAATRMIQIKKKMEDSPKTYNLTGITFNEEDERYFLDMAGRNDISIEKIL